MLAQMRNAALTFSAMKLFKNIFEIIQTIQVLFPSLVQIIQKKIRLTLPLHAALGCSRWSSGGAAQSPHRLWSLCAAGGWRALIFWTLLRSDRKTEKQRSFRAQAGPLCLDPWTDLCSYKYSTFTLTGALTRPGETLAGVNSLCAEVLQGNHEEMGKIYCSLNRKWGKRTVLE